MEPAHHKETASNSRNTRRVNYNKQAALLAQGKFMEAFYEDVQDLYAAVFHAGGAPQDYEAAIAQTSAYTECLNRIGRVQ